MMLKTGKKILCTLLVVIMCLTSAPLQGFVGLEWPDLPNISFAEMGIFSIPSLRIYFDVPSINIKKPSTLNKLNINFNIGTWFSNKARAGYPSSSGTCGEGLTYTYDWDTDKLVISGIGTISDHCFNNSSIKTVIINDGVSGIGNRTFENCDNLESVTIPASVTTVGRNAFRFCDKLTINCKALSQPSGWDATWNSYNCPVNWGV